MMIGTRLRTNLRTNLGGCKLDYIIYYRPIHRILITSNFEKKPRTAGPCLLRKSSASFLVAMVVAANPVLFRSQIKISSLQLCINHICCYWSSLIMKFQMVRLPPPADGVTRAVHRTGCQSARLLTPRLHLQNLFGLTSTLRHSI